MPVASSLASQAAPPGTGIGTTPRGFSARPGDGGGLSTRGRHSSLTGTP